MKNEIFVFAKFFFNQVEPFGLCFKRLWVMSPGHELSELGQAFFNGGDQRGGIYDAGWF